MDFRGRSAQTPNTQAAGSSAGSVQSSGANQFQKLQKQPLNKLLKIGGVVLLFAATALLVALTFLLFLGGNSQAKSVLKDKYQAVFLNNGQVYFGNIKSFARDSIKFQDIYYLQTNSTDGNSSTTAAANNNVSLVKLGCELHAPYDEMLINKDQVIFWENLQDSSQVVKAIAEYKKQNPKAGCSEKSQGSTQQAAPTTPVPTPANPTNNPNSTIRKP